MGVFRKSEKGMALPTVIMVMLISFTLCASVLVLAESQTKTEISYESSTQALHAAEAGINLYLWSLNKEGESVALGSVIEYPDTNPKYGFILNESTNEAGLKVITSKGWALYSPDITQTITATLKKKSFTEHVYFTDFEDTSIVWGNGEVCYGPLHSNTSLKISGSPKFYGRVTYVDSLHDSDAVNPIYGEGPHKIDKIEFKNSNSELIQHSTDGGYYFYGRTSIKMNSNGTLDIWCPNGLDPKGSNAGLSNSETRVYGCPLPSNGVIYVEGGDEDSEEQRFARDVGNVFISGKLKGRLTVAAGANIYITDYNPTIENFAHVDRRNDKTNGVSYANVGFEFVDAGDRNKYYKQTGDGDDMLGLIANKNVGILTRGWFKCKTEAVIVKEYYTYNGRTYAYDVTKILSEKTVSGEPINVHAAVMAIGGKFFNTHHETSPLESSPPNIILRGSLIQKHRGAVGIVGGAGYSKNYAHDTRMAVEQPPYFLEPANAGWEVISWN